MEIPHPFRILTEARPDLIVFVFLRYPAVRIYIYRMPPPTRGDIEPHLNKCLPSNAFHQWKLRITSITPRGSWIASRKRRASWGKCPNHAEPCVAPGRFGSIYESLAVKRPAER